MEPLTSKMSRKDKGKKPRKKKLVVVEENLVIAENQVITEAFTRECEKPYMGNYLKSLKTKPGSNNEFKRVIISPLRYAGGKSKAIGLILKYFPCLREKKVVSPFFGGGSFELCLSQILGIQVIGYDIFDMLTNFWTQVIESPKQFVKELRKFEVTSEEFTRNRHILLHYWNKIKPADLNYKTKKVIELTDDEKGRLDDSKMMQAVYYYYNMSLSYGPMFLGWPSANEIKKDKYDRRMKKLEKLQLKNLRVSTGDFEEVLEKHNDDFLFLDPPYYLDGDSKMFKGMYPNCNFAIHHNNFKHEKMRDMLKSHRGGFFITYNNCPTIREWYKDFEQVFPEWQYTYGQGETRIGKNRKEGTNDNLKESHEIFIICSPL